jgi:SAM-dependent methyltransferase
MPVIDTIKGSSDRFGYSWDRFFDLTPEQEEQFKLWTTPVDPVNGWKGVRFLDAGCGMGRNSYWAIKNGARSGVAIDLDDRTLDRARSNLSQFAVAVHKASIYEIPFQNEFDIAFSIGVIHHLEFPHLAIQQLVKATKPGGRVLVWVYGYENLEFYVKVLNPLRIAVFSRIPLPVVHAFAFAPTAALWVLLRLGFHPFAYLKMLNGFSFKHLHHIVFDQMLPQTAFYWRQNEALALLEMAGLKDIQIHWVNQCSWSVMGIKPLEA